MKSNRNSSLALGLLSIVFVSYLATAPPSAAEETADLPNVDHFRHEILPDRASFGLSMLLSSLPSGESVLRVEGLLKEGPGEEAGIRVGDLVVGIDGELPPYENDLQRVIHLDRYRAGDVALFEVESHGTRRLIELRAEAMDAERQEHLLRWVEIARQRLDSGKPVYCATDTSSEDPWVQLLVRAESYPGIILTLEKLGENDFSILHEPAHFPLPKNLTPSHFRAPLRADLDALEVGQALEIHIRQGTAGDGHPVITAEVLDRAPSDP